MRKPYLFQMRHVSVRYGDFYALRDVNITAEPGDFIALMGENGAGKSTMLNTLVGILTPAEGTVDFNEDCLDRKNPFASIGFSAQSLIADWYLKAEDNVYLGCILAGMTPEEAWAATRKALERVHLTEKAQSRIDDLSGGQGQRVQIARVIAASPALYILDEPTTGLDAELSEQLFQFFHEEQLRGRTIIVSSHDLYLLETYCNKMLYLEKGRVRYWGAMADFLKTYTPAPQFRLSLRRAIPPDALPQMTSFSLVSAGEGGDDREIVVEPAPGRSLSDILQEAAPYEILACSVMKECSLRSFFAHRGEGQG